MKLSFATALNWGALGIFAFCVAIFVGYLLWKNLKDEKEVIKSFNEELKPEVHEQDDDII